MKRNGWRSEKEMKSKKIRTVAVMGIPENKKKHEWIVFWCSNRIDLDWSLTICFTQFASVSPAHKNAQSSTVAPTPTHHRSHHSPVWYHSYPHLCPFSRFSLFFHLTFTTSCCITFVCHAIVDLCLSFSVRSLLIFLTDWLCDALSKWTKSFELQFTIQLCCVIKMGISFIIPRNPFWSIFRMMIFFPFFFLSLCRCSLFFFLYLLWYTYRTFHVFVHQLNSSINTQ